MVFFSIHSAPFFHPELKEGRSPSQSVYTTSALHQSLQYERVPGIRLCTRPLLLISDRSLLDSSIVRSSGGIQPETDNLRLPMKISPCAIAFTANTLPEIAA